MNTRKIREDLGRIRTSIQRRDYPRAVQHLCFALKELGGQTAPLDLRGDFRTGLADICANPVYKKTNPQPMLYQPGKEKDLYSFFRAFYAALVGEEEEEDYESTLERKLNLDRCINNGKAFITQAKFTEADDCFAEALKYYKDEIAAFAIMAKAMMEAEQYVRALGYIRKGLEKSPNNVELNKLSIQCNRQRGK